jgi:uncharacterized membrane protein
MTEKTFAKVFKTIIFLKGLGGAFGIIGGLALLFISSETITKTVTKLFEHELLQDPNDLIVTYLMQISQHISVDAKSFGALFLIINGCISLGLVIALWRKKMWAYPVAATVLIAFVIYQYVRYTHTQLLSLMILMLFDLLIAVLVILRYQDLKEERKLICKKSP